ncbi:MAG: methyltransferase domain-containing protein [Trebonia sp.]
MTLPTRAPAHATLRSFLDAIGFCVRVEAARGKGCAPYEPWPAMADDRGADPWVSALHGARSGGVMPSAAGHQEAVPALCGLGLLGDSQPFRPGRWEATSFHGIVVVRDRSAVPGEGRVYLGEDGLRFAEAVMRVRAAGSALDIGCGSGLVTAALALTCDTVLGVDVVPECVDATAATAVLNGLSGKVSVREGDLMTADFPAAFDCVAANLPGVPVPRGLRYSRAGDGGPDGLRLIRGLLERAPGWIRRPESSARNPVLLMRFQCLGDRSGPMLMRELAEHARANAWDIEVVSDSRVAAEVRSALTAYYAGPLNPELSGADILRLADDHARELGATCFYSSTLIARPGAGSVRFVDLARPQWLDTPVTTPRDATGLKGMTGTVEHRYYSRLGTLPEGYWEMGTEHFITVMVERWPALLDRWASGGVTLRQVLDEEFADEFARDPLAARSLYTTGSLLLDVLGRPGTGGGAR